jgi:glycosyltransferase involved in cell wall biosynthesis
MISFITIGRNEGWKLTRCLKSVLKTINTNNLKKCEIIYVDSNSTDDSLDRAISFPNVKCYKITGICNAAIARNIGAKESSGDILFFIDGDMEIISDFLPLVYEENFGLNQDFVSGQFINYNYDYTGNLLSKEPYFRNTLKHTQECTTGGLFLVKRDIWNKIGGMKNKLKRNEDIDFGIRLAKIGIFLLRRGELLAIHHTVSYHNPLRIWKTLFTDAELYRAVLLRDNITNKYHWKFFLRENYSAVFLIAVFSFSFFSNVYFLFLVYFFVILFRGFIKPGTNILSKINIAIYYMVRDILFLSGFLFFWPRGNKQISYKKY